jgi:hypothetical protein
MARERQRGDARAIFQQIHRPSAATSPSRSVLVYPASLIVTGLATSFPSASKRRASKTRIPRPTSGYALWP